MNKHPKHDKFIEWLQQHQDTAKAVTPAPGMMIPNVGEYCKKKLYQLENTTSEKQYKIHLYHVIQLIKSL